MAFTTFCNVAYFRAKEDIQWVKAKSWVLTIGIYNISLNQYLKIKYNKIKTHFTTEFWHLWVKQDIKRENTYLAGDHISREEFVELNKFIGSGVKLQRDAV